MLPVSSVNPNDVYLGSLPHDPVVIPGLQIPDGMGPVAQLAAGQFLYCLAVNNKRNAARTFLYNLLTQNNLDNDDVRDAVTLTLQNGLMKQAKYQMDLNQAMEQSAAEIAPILTIFYAKRFNVPFGGQQEMETYSRAEHDYNVIQNEIEAFMRTGGNMQYNNDPRMGNPVPPQPNYDPRMGSVPPNPGYGPGGGYGPPPGPSYDPRMGSPGGFDPRTGAPLPNPSYDPRWGNLPPGPGYGRGPQQPPNGYAPPPPPPGPGYGGHGMPPQGNMNNVGSSFQTQPNNQPMQNFPGQDVQRNVGRKYAQMSGNGNGPTQPNQGQGWNNQPEPSFQAFDVRNQQQAGKPMYEPNNGYEPQRPQERFVDQEELVDVHTSPFPTNAPFGEPDGQNDDHWIYIDKGDGAIEKTFDPLDPYPHAYNPHTHLRVFAVSKKDGSVKEQFEKRGPNMNYEDHELEPNVLNRTPVNKDAKVVPNDELLITTQEVDDKKEELPEEELEKMNLANKLVSSGKVVFAHSRPQADMLTRSHLYAKGLSFLNESGYEFRYKEVSPYFDLTDEKKVEQKVEHLFGANDLNDFVYKLKVASKDEDFPEELLGDIIERSTNAMNEALETGLGLDWSITSLLYDWKDLTDTFEEEFGSERGSEYIALLESKARRSIITGNMTLLRGSDKNEAFRSLYTKELREEMGLEEVRTLIFVETKSVTKIPYTAQELHLRLENKRGAVNESELPGLYRLLKGISGRNNNSVKRNVPMMLKTRDGKVFSIHKGILNPNYYVIKDRTFD